MASNTNSRQIWYAIGVLADILLVGWALLNRNGTSNSIFGFGNTDTQATTTEETTTGTTAGTGGT